MLRFAESASSTYDGWGSFSAFAAKKARSTLRGHAIASRTRELRATGSSTSAARASARSRSSGRIFTPGYRKMRRLLRVRFGVRLVLGEGRLHRVRLHRCFVGANEARIG